MMKEYCKQDTFFWLDYYRGLIHEEVERIQDFKKHFSRRQLDFLERKIEQWKAEAQAQA